MRGALALLDDQVILIATILFDDPSLPEVGTAMSLLSSLRFEHLPRFVPSFLPRCAKSRWWRSSRSAAQRS
ncbi:MAG TPA: hypothetical protein VKE24_09565 [Candidatus Acidoferrales bacterium]|nr:hypothetical protein [Candidatus Acidoferrales bacterium]